MKQARTAIVTGGARGIGEAVARRLSDDGMAVAIVDLDQDVAAEAADRICANGGTAIGVGADVAHEDQVTAAISSVHDSLGPATVLVNNAGILRDNLLFKMSLEDWEQVMQVHLRGAFLLARACQTAMVEAKWGRIVNISSSSALGNRGQVNYSAAKAGLQGFTKTLAKELGRFGVTANSVAPGFIETEMTRQTAERMGIPFDELIEQGAKPIAVGRVGQPDDVAAAVSFFTREDSSFISGQVLYVAGGPLN